MKVIVLDIENVSNSRYHYNTYYNEFVLDTFLDIVTIIIMFMAMTSDKYYVKSGIKRNSGKSGKTLGCYNYYRQIKTGNEATGRM